MLPLPLCKTALVPLEHKHIRRSNIEVKRHPAVLRGSPLLHPKTQAHSNTLRRLAPGVDARDCNTLAPQALQIGSHTPEQDRHVISPGVSVSIGIARNTSNNALSNL